MDLLANVIILGAGATLLVDAWALLRRRVFGLALPDYGLVGRWIGHMAHGQFRHAAIAASSPIRAERIIGWSAHYLIGIGFAGILLALMGLEWSRQPTPGPALLFGIGTVAAPFLLMQPGMGAGIAASRTRQPGAARLQSVVTHAVFGLGLFVAGSLARVTS
jgi:hypothetical protein